MTCGDSPERVSSRPRLFVGVIAAHLIAGLVLGGVTRGALRSWYPGAIYVLAGFACAQASLVGLWAALGRTPWLLRLVGLVIGGSSLGLWCSFCIGGLDLEVLALLLGTGILASAGLLSARCLGVGLVDAREAERCPAPAQFTIRQLMLATVLVACWLAAARWLWLLSGDGTAHGIRLLAVVIVAALPFAGVAVAAAWALLGTQRPLRGLVCLFGIAVLAAYALGLLPEVHDSADDWAKSTLTQAATLAISLAALRSRVRLRRRPALDGRSCRQ